GEKPAFRTELCQRGCRERSLARVQHLGGMSSHVCQHVLFVVFRINLGIDGFVRFSPLSEFGAARDGGGKQDRFAGKDCSPSRARHGPLADLRGCRCGAIYRTQEVAQTAPHMGVSRAPRYWGRGFRAFTALPSVAATMSLT